MSEQPGRYQRSASGMLGALVVTLLVIGAFVAFRAFDRSGLQVGPERVDYLAQVRYAQEAGAKVVYPARLPSGWYATQVTVTPGSPPGLELSMLTAGGQYVGLVQSSEPLADVLTTYVDTHPQAGPSVTVSGRVVSSWKTWTDTGGDTALAAAHGHGTTQESLLVFGTVPRAELERLAGSLTTAKLGG
jgi:hypothetical protein